MKKMKMTKYVLGIYKAKFYKYLMTSVFVVWLANGIVEFEQSFFCINIFHCKGQIGQNMSVKNYNIFCRYHICIKGLRVLLPVSSRQIPKSLKIVPAAPRLALRFTG